MDEIIFFGGLILFFLFGPWVLVWVGHRRRKREREEDRQRWGELTRRVYALEETVKRVQPGAKQEISALPRPEESQAQPESKGLKTTSSKIPAMAVTPITSPASSVADDRIRQAAAPPRPVPGPISQPSPRASAPTSAPPSSSIFATLRSSLDLEEALGTNWLNKIGIS